MLVTQDGLFSGHDTLKYCPRSGLHPNWRLARFQPVGGGLGWAGAIPYPIAPERRMPATRLGRDVADVPVW